MADTITNAYQFVKPEPDGSADTWGIKLNANWDAIDALLKATDINLAVDKESIIDADKIAIRDSQDGDALKLVTMGVIRKNVLDKIIPEGTVTIFAQSTAPTGWTKLTTHNDAALRVTSGSVSSGGSIDFTAAFKSHTPTGTITATTATGSVGGTSLTVSNLPPHYHEAGSLSAASHTHGAGTLAAASHTHGAGSLAAASAGSHTHTVLGGTTGAGGYSCGLGYSGSRGVGGMPYDHGNAYRSTLSNGAAIMQAGGAHSHTLTGSTAASGTLDVSGSTSATAPSVNGSTASTGSGTAHTHSFTGSPHTHTFTGEAINLAVKYVDVIMAKKDAN